jgi:hypothetical protein
VSVLHDPTILDLLRKAWEDSQPGTGQAHEEGGFVLKNVDGSLSVERWGRGAQDQIAVPPHPNGKRGDALILATFHTHPNISPEYLQEPSPTDVWAVRDDADLHHPDYEGEYVIATGVLYLILPDGSVEQRGKTKDVFKLGD